MPPRAASPRDPIPKKTEVLAVSADKGGPSFLDRMSPFEDGSIDRLNAEVQQKLLSPAMAALAGKEAVAAVRAGEVVYKRRSWVTVLAFWALIAYCLSQSPSVPFAIGALVIMWFSVDLFGAVLHVVLDTAAFVNFPLIGAGCLEFQWHHAIPHDITTKPFVEVCGDLNLAAALHVAWHLYVWGYENKAANTMVAARFFMAFMGQWAHRQAHMPANARQSWVVAAQNIGFLVSPALHKAHHTNYDGSFPILNGWSAPLVAAMERAVPNRYCWLAFFIFLCLADCFILTKLYIGAVGHATTAGFLPAGFLPA